MDHFSIDARVERIANALQLLVARLREQGYEFARPAEVLPGPESTVEQSLQRIAAEVGSVPYAVAAFWRRVGSVDLCGGHPDWGGCEFPDPLVVEPVSHAIADREDRLQSGFPYLITISADSYHKEEVSGGMGYNVSCPAMSDDPLVNDERHEVSFLNYLELALRWGGFPGLDQSLVHSWPLQQLAMAVNDTA